MENQNRCLDHGEEIEALRNALRQREYEIELLKETALAVGRELDPGVVLQLVADRAREIIQAETVLIPLLDEDRGSYTYHAGSGQDTREIVGETLSIDQGICGWVWRNKKPWWRGVLDELDESDRTRWEEQAGTVIMVPLVGKGSFLGGLTGLRKLDGGDFTRADLNLLSLFASQVVVALENAFAFEKLEQAKQEAERFQQELHQLNNELVSANRQLEYLSLYDELTELPNRTLFRDRIHQGITVADVIDQPLAVLLIDLDQFKEVNDTFGHEFGDRLLQLVSERFSAITRYSDTLGRLGGDEFGLLLPNADEAKAAEIANTLLRSLDTCIELEGHGLSMTASIGIAVYPQHGIDITTLLRHADMAMYQAKSSKQSLSVYDPDNDQYSPQQLTLLGDLRRALNEDQFQLHYQPKIDIRTGRLVGVEALSRWVHPQRGIISPTAFIHALEQTGLISSFNQWVLGSAVEQAARWRDRGYCFKVAVNLSVHSLLNPAFPDELEALMDKWEITDQLVLEITENLFLSDYGRLSDTLLRLQRRGVAFSIDDFGTGHSSLSRLKKLPVTELKIDRSFVIEMENNDDDTVIVHSTIELAHNLGLAVVAEGVENASILRHLESLGCDIAQGYHFGKAMPASELEKKIIANRWLEEVAGETAAQPVQEASDSVSR